MSLKLSVSLCFAAALLLQFPGCAKKTKTEAKPAQDDKKPVKHEHAKGPHGGHLFDVGPGHKYMGELVIKDGKLELYLVDHHDTKKPIVSDSKAITITDIKHGGKALDPIKLEPQALKDDKGGSSRFVSEKKLPNEIDDADALNGAKFTVSIAGKEIAATITAEHND